MIFEKSILGDQNQILSAKTDKNIKIIKLIVLPSIITFWSLLIIIANDGSRTKYWRTLKQVVVTTRSQNIGGWAEEIDPRLSEYKHCHYAQSFIIEIELFRILACTIINVYLIQESHWNIFSLAILVRSTNILATFHRAAYSRNTFKIWPILKFFLYI